MIASSIGSPVVWALRYDSVSAASMVASMEHEVHQSVPCAVKADSIFERVERERRKTLCSVGAARERRVRDREGGGTNSGLGRERGECKEHGTEAASLKKLRNQLEKHINANGRRRGTN